MTALERLHRRDHEEDQQEEDDVDHRRHVDQVFVDARATGFTSSRRVLAGGLRPAVVRRRSPRRRRIVSCASDAAGIVTVVAHARADRRAGRREPRRPSAACRSSGSGSEMLIGPPPFSVTATCSFTPSAAGGGRHAKQLAQPHLLLGLDQHRRSCRRRRPARPPRRSARPAPSPSASASASSPSPIVTVTPLAVEACPARVTTTAVVGVERLARGSPSAG